MIQKQFKVCKCCNRNLPLEDFYLHHKDKPDSHVSQCKECQKRYRRKRSSQEKAQPRASRLSRSVRIDKVLTLMRDNPQYFGEFIIPQLSPTIKKTDLAKYEVLMRRLMRVTSIHARLLDQFERTNNPKLPDQLSTFYGKMVKTKSEFKELIEQTHES